MKHRGAQHTQTTSRWTTSNRMRDSTMVSPKLSSDRSSRPTSLRTVLEAKIEDKLVLGIQRRLTLCIGMKGYVAAVANAPSHGRELTGLRVTGFAERTDTELRRSANARARPSTSNKK